MTEYETITLSLIVKPKGEPIFSERSTIVEMTDEASGPFVTIRQTNDDILAGEIRMDSSDWKPIREAIETMINICETQDKSINPEQ